VKTTTIVALTGIVVLAASCDDDVPPGLIDALQHAITGQRLNCPGTPCTQVNEINIAATDTAAALNAEAMALYQPWCPRYTFKAERILENAGGEVSKDQSYSVKVVGFGEVGVTTADVVAEVRALDDGWMTTLTHTHQAGAGECPTEWPAKQCEVQVSYELESDGEISISWIAGTETKTATAAASETIKSTTATASEWCEKRQHADPRPCSGTATSDSGTVGCTSDADCSQLPCGEWVCKAGACTRLETAPDGTPCDGGRGKCEAGQCKQ
jgi:hypothetical protein